MKNKRLGTGIALMSVLLGLAPLLAGCGDFWALPATATTTTLTSTSYSMTAGNSFTLTGTVEVSSTHLPGRVSRCDRIRVGQLLLPRRAGHLAVFLGCRGLLGRLRLLGFQAAAILLQRGELLSKRHAQQMRRSSKLALAVHQEQHEAGLGELHRELDRQVVSLHRHGDGRAVVVAPIQPRQHPASPMPRVRSSPATIASFAAN